MPWSIVGAMMIAAALAWTARRQPRRHWFEFRAVAMEGGTASLNTRSIPIVAIFALACCGVMFAQSLTFAAERKSAPAPSPIVRPFNLLESFQTVGPPQVDLDRTSCKTAAGGEAAVAACSRLIDLYPKDAQWYYHRGVAKYEMRDYDRAIADYREAIRLDAKFAAAFSGRGNAYRGQGDYLRAIADYDEAIRLDPKIADVAEAKAALAIKVDQLFNCAAFNLANDRVAACSRLTERYPNDASAFYQRGDAFRARGDHDRAIADYDEALRLDPNLTAAAEAKAAVIAAKAAAAAAEAQVAADRTTCLTEASDDAVVACSRLISRYPRDAFAFTNRGLAYNNKRDYDRAIADLNEAIRLDPNRAVLFNNRGFAYLKKSDNERAIADLNQAIRLDPKYAEAFKNRGGAYLAKLNYDSAIKDLNDAIRLNPEDAEAYNNSGYAYSKRLDYERAIADYGNAIRLDPKFAIAFKNRGDVLRAKGDHDRAIADYDEALRLDPNLTAAAEAKAAVAVQIAANAKAAADAVAVAQAKAAVEARASQAKAATEAQAAAEMAAANAKVAARNAALDVSRKRHFNSVAILIGNADYEEAPPVKFAGNDAKAMKDYLVSTLGFREENVRVMLNLTREKMDRLFGNPNGGNQVMTFVRQRRKDVRGDVFVYYSGHGVPNPIAVREEDKQAYLLPVDVAPDRGPDAGVSLQKLQDTLENVRHELPSDRNVVLMLDTCFGGRLLRFSGAMSPPIPSAPAGLVRLIGATGDELAAWNEKRQLGLFTSLFLDAVAGGADGEGYGNRDGRVEGRELEDYLRDRLPSEAAALSTNGREQHPSLDGLDHMLWAPAVTRTGAAVQ